MDVKFYMDDSNCALYSFHVNGTFEYLEKSIKDLIKEYIEQEKMFVDRVGKVNMIYCTTVSHQKKANKVLPKCGFKIVARSRESYQEIGDTKFWVKVIRPVIKKEKNASASKSISGPRSSLNANCASYNQSALE